MSYPDKWADHSAVFVPDHVEDVTLYLTRIMRRPLEGLCLAEERRAHGKWVCALSADHEGKHG